MIYPGLSETRARIDATADPVARYALKLAYLLCVRANELCGVNQASDLVTEPDGLEHYLSKAIGPTKNEVEYDTYEGSELMKVTVQIEKRRKDVVRVVALPMSPEFEPWTAGLSNRFAKLDRFDKLLPFPRWRLVKWINESGLGIPGKYNPLRHLRLNHLTQYYGFNADDRTLIAGWSFSSGARSSGPQDEYLNLDWRPYYPKLLKPLPRVEPMAPTLPT